jgi:hypothetical protein
MELAITRGCREIETIAQWNAETSQKNAARRKILANAPSEDKHLQLAIKSEKHSNIYILIFYFYLFMFSFSLYFHFQLLRSTNESITRTTIQF